MTGRSSKSRRAAAMYLDALAEGAHISMKICAERYGVSVGTVHAVVAQLRRERQEQDAQLGAER